LAPSDYNPRDHAATSLCDRQLLESADLMVKQGKKVLIIVDACFCGQLRLAAQEYLQRYSDSRAGGLVLMLSSMPNQTSTDLGQYSAFAKALADGMDGAADLDNDGYVTIQEIQRYAYERTHELLRQRGIKTAQDGECDWSLSISENMKLAVAPRSTLWTGKEQLKGYGKLSFRLYSSGEAVMTDSREMVTGTWRQEGNEVTLRFFNDRVVYRGFIRDSVMYGMARNVRSSWSWTVIQDTVAN
jgi:hypothetical protein